MRFRRWSPSAPDRRGFDIAGDAAFRERLSDVTIDARAATFGFDGAFADIRAVPEPSSALPMLLGIGAVVLRRRGATVERFPAA